MSPLETPEAMGTRLYGADPRREMITAAQVAIREDRRVIAEAAEREADADPDEAGAFALRAFARALRGEP